jgi:hypothetical protein
LETASDSEANKENPTKITNTTPVNTFFSTLIKFAAKVLFRSKVTQNWELI